MSVLRLFNPDRDSPPLHAIFGDEESCRYMSDPATATVEETVSLLTKWNEGTEETTWAIVEREDGDALGRITMIPRGGHVWEVGIMLCPAAQGRGLAFTALCAALDSIFDKHEARRVYADIDPDNKPSIRLFERAGFQREGLLRAAWKTHIGVRDSIIMGFVSSDPRPWRHD
ncbi:GNAT family N-acetyltransferase [Hyphococcus flavus]|uniref:GNAT family N-acetyltransferase n=1 Tax=Hyphococcus flavus TaxID=1866326 RepID=A0AAF0CI98_9PROT|nr:GNAT family N-acetyltransferase [Hyphococcus flavus]WDI32652.1 GNAT family N-acetyltransferase [Hyphococcus flavus]